MKTGIANSAYLKRYGMDAGLKKMLEHGYETIDFQDFADTNHEFFSYDDEKFAAYFREIREKTEACGMEISQTHGPWRWPPRDFSPEDRAERFEKMSRSIVGTRLLGCKNFVIHPIMPFGDNQDPEPEKLWEMNYEFMGRLCDVADDNDVTICFENMPMRALSLSTPAQILSFVRTMNRENFKICLDTGHCAVFGIQPGAAVREIGKDYLRVLHVHDNSGHGDQHWIPYSGFIDWNDFSDALAEIGFEGSVSLECEISGKVPQEAREYMEIGLAKMAAKIAKKV